jgi:biotin operon repressor
MSSMETTAARLLRLLSLLQRRREWTGQELAARLKVSGRTVRHDIQRLRELGYPVDATRGYRLGVGAALPPLLLDDDEAVAVAVGLRTAAGGTVTGIAVDIGHGFWTPVRRAGAGGVRLGAEMSVYGPAGASMNLNDVGLSSPL